MPEALAESSLLKPDVDGEIPQIPERSSGNRKIKEKRIKIKAETQIIGKGCRSY
jgi:hypothetical protein